ncbi:tetratricopeptide repeat protein [uncultured Thiodictyon sp.]|jgi:tetratricopeptide (TPR) repeat protein|uniref:tetratricopeptide repeat protein n=1 Tax=uncultured Thiodictyon sp. TaxID=1846217 RepID=UPI0025D9F37B|nr:tetratricopeptide repeat protein [uncultured Thiodictyon sp.]
MKIEFLPSATPWSTFAPYALAAIFCLLVSALAVSPRHRHWPSPWRWVWFRYLAWWVGRRGGSAWRWLTTGWRVLIAPLAAVIGAIWLRDHVLDIRRSASDILSISFVLKVAAVTALLTLGWWLYRARRRMVILPFADHTGDAALAAGVAGLPSRLLNEWARLRSLYQFTDEARPEQKSDAPIDVTVGVEDLGEVLQGAVSADSKIGLGPLQVPVGALLSVGGRAAEGPRLTGSVYKDGDRLVVVALVRGGGRHESWRVEQGCETLQKLIEQLAYRIFTDLSKAGSEQWQAVYHYTQGLRAYREAKWTERNKILKYVAAEKAFIHALEEDNRFARCHYNLAIVYRALGRKESAEFAFCKAVETNPDLYDAYYALALNYFNTERYEEAIRLCGKAIQLRPSQAEGWDLRGFARRKLAEQHVPRMANMPVESINDGETAMALVEDIRTESIKARETAMALVKAIRTESIQDRETATALAWHALCRSALRGEADPKLRESAITCTRSLAVGHAIVGSYPRSRVIFCQAIHLAPTLAELRFELGKVLFEAEDWQGAQRSLEAANEDALNSNDRAIYWAYIAEACVRFPDQSHGASGTVAAAQRRFIDTTLIADKPENVGRGVKNLESVRNDYEQAKSVLDRLKPRKQESGPDHITRLEGELRNHQHRDWAVAAIAVKLAELCLELGPSDSGAASKATGYLLQAFPGLEQGPAAIDWKSGGLGLIRENGVYGLLAGCEMVQDRPDMAKALANAERAVMLNPLRAWERSILGSVYLLLNDHEQALAEWSTGLNLDPKNREILGKMADTYARRGSSLLSPAARRQDFQQVVNLLRLTQEIMENDWQPAKDLEDQGMVHYLLAWSHRELLDYDASISHFKIALAMRYKPLESTVELCWTSVCAKAYNEAEAAFREAVTRVMARRRQKRSGALAADFPEEDTNALLTQGYLQSAFAFAERGGNLEWAARRLRFAKRRTAHIVPARRTTFQAAYHDCQGWVLFHQEKWDQAIAELERATALVAESGTYYRLAYAYLRKGESDASERARWLERARRAGIHAREADLNGQYRQEIDDLLKRLDQSEARCKPASAAAAQLAITFKDPLSVTSWPGSAVSSAGLSPGT